MVIVDNVPLFFQERDGPWCPTLRILHQYPECMQKVRIGAVGAWVAVDAWGGVAQGLT